MNETQLGLRSAQPKLGTLLSLSRGLQALSVVLESARGVSLTDVADAMGLHKATVLRLLRTLVDEGYVTADPSDPRGPRYLPGPAVLTYSARTQAGALAQVAGPVLAELSDASRETVSLFVPAWPDLICCAAIPSPELIRRHREIGERQAMTTASVSRAFLCRAPADYVAATLEARPLEKRTEHSVTDRDEFLRRLREDRRRGYSASYEETNLDMAGVAVPVVAGDAALPLGVISVSGPLFRWGPEQIDAFAPALVAAAQRLARQVTNLG